MDPDFVFELVWWTVVIVHFIVALFAIRSLGQCTAVISIIKLFFWIAFIALVPLVGSIVWMKAGRKRADAAMERAAEEESRRAEASTAGSRRARD
ncbi:hypothetical protein [Leucobacter iarius]|uniref:Cardiolipin synthase N-terminal domain-containing protein n=1 Tax=Leucobacter iarius TaxID=333963 RepID=A0ABP4XRA9_9MICO